MLGIDPRAARAAWTVFLLALAIATAYLVRETLVVFMIALLFAYLLMPLVGLVERFTPRQVSQGFALAIVYLLLIGALIGLALTLGSRLVDEANSLASRLPDLLRNRSWIDQIPLPSWLEPARARIAGTIQSELNSGGQQFLPYLRSIGGQIISGARYVVYVVLIPILAFFFLKDGSTMRVNAVDSLFEPRAGRSSRKSSKTSIACWAIIFARWCCSGARVRDQQSVPRDIRRALRGPAGRMRRGRRIPSGGGTGRRRAPDPSGDRPGGLHPSALRLTLDSFPHVSGLRSPYLMGRGVKLNPMLVLFGVLAGDQIAAFWACSFPCLDRTLRVLFVRLQRFARANW